MGGKVQAVPPLPACDTVTVCEATPLAATVTVAARAALPVFAWAVAVTLALLDPAAGLTLNQAWSSLTVQLVFDVTLKLPLLLAAAARLNADGDTDSVVPVVQLVAGDPVPEGAAVDVVRLILSRRAPSSR